MSPRDLRVLLFLICFIQVFVDNLKLNISIKRLFNLSNTGLLSSWCRNLSVASMENKYSFCFHLGDRTLFQFRFQNWNLIGKTRNGAKRRESTNANLLFIYIITKSMRTLWLVNQLWFIVPENSWKFRASSELLYKSNRPQVSMVYRLINHTGCWKNTRRIRKSRAAITIADWLIRARALIWLLCKERWLICAPTGWN